MTGLPAPTASAVLVAWLAFVGGVAWALRPLPSAAPDEMSSQRLVLAWQQTLPSRVADTTLLVPARAGCECDAAALSRLVAWSEAAGIAVRSAPADGVEGVALLDGHGRIRYVGDAASLLEGCGAAEVVAQRLQYLANAPEDAPMVRWPCACQKGRSL